jgi:hypothetical protein
MGLNPLFAPHGFGVAPTPWQAVQEAAWVAIGRGARVSARDETV